ncbi:MAG: hypothetical protein FJ144_23455 [Deltaproteobacteria bacterium]|nr:hypothetical protein [Deltaproteobacteria bacterium]
MIDALLGRLRAARWANLFVVNLRFLIGFAFVPAALKKVLGQPFTDPTNHGPFHDFLHGFHATGGFYAFVGVLQLVAAALLCTQRWAALGAALALPILTAIGVFCWSTGIVYTSIVVTLMWLGTIGLLVWDLDRWRLLLARGDRPHEVHYAPPPARIDMRLWERCGFAILALYLGSALVRGGVYRPRRIEWDEPAFWVLPAVMLLPVLTFVIDQRRSRLASPDDDR